MVKKIALGTVGVTAGSALGVYCLATAAMGERLHGTTIIAMARGRLYAWCEKHRP